MSVRVRIAEGPLSPAAPWAPAGAGAVNRFEGNVRPHEGDRDIEALEYEAYEPMASTLLRRLAEQAIERFGLIAVEVEHSRSVVPAGHTSFRLSIASAHRAEALQATAWFIDAMKRDVPIWKTPLPAGQGAGRRAEGAATPPAPSEARP